MWEFDARGWAGRAGFEKRDNIAHCGANRGAARPMIRELEPLMCARDPFPHREALAARAGRGVFVAIARIFGSSGAVNRALLAFPWAITG
jgi:hypothetical protein